MKRTPERTRTWWRIYNLCLFLSIISLTFLRGQGNGTQWIQPEFLEADVHTPIQIAREWLNKHAQNPEYRESTFQWSEPTQDISGGVHLTATQYYQGIPVFDGFIRFHFHYKGHLSNVQKHLLPLVSTPTHDLIPIEEFQERALTVLRQHYPHLALGGWRLKDSTHTILHPDILRALPAKKGHRTYIQRWEHSSGSAYTLYWDTQNGQLLAHLQAHCEFFRHQLYDVASRQTWRSGDEIPDNFDQFKRWQISASEQTYNLFRSAFGRNSYDGNGAAFRSFANASLPNCPNARWNGNSTLYCTGVSSDDVVAHEWAHAYTQHTNDLIYAWQSGAINEAYSDIWGEVVDLLNDEGNDLNDHQSRLSCDNSIRWKIAEDVAVINGPIRDLWSPNCHADPASIDDPHYDCNLDELDAGGVHNNSGLVNRTFALLVDGDSTYAGIGLTKAAHLFWHTQAHYLSRTSDFRTLAAALSVAYNDLSGQDLPELRLTDTLRQLSGEKLIPSDSIWLAEVLRRTGLAQPLSQCANFSPLLAQSPPAACPAEDQRAQLIFQENFEEGLANWQTTTLPAFLSQWEERNWEVSNLLPTGRAGQAAFAMVPNNSSSSPKQGGLLRLESPRIDFPTTGSDAYELRFEHAIALESGDGGRLTYRHNDDNWTPIPPGAFTYNGYQEFLPITLATSGNPLTQQWLFTGTDQGASSGSWGMSIIDLSSLGVTHGDSLWLRWELGTNHSLGYEGWYIDDVVISTCQAGSLLPVEWLSFTANVSENSITLDWATAAEYNNAGFFVERSTDGQSFYAQDWVPASDKQVYTWEDAELEFGQWYYYRLRQVDIDGSHDYSPIRKVKLDFGTNPKVWAYPNPVQSELYIRSIPDEPIQAVSLHTIMGTLAQYFTSDNSNSDNIWELALNGLPPGTYTLTIELPTRQHQQLIVIQQ